MKRKRRTGKLTTSELLEAGYPALAAHLRARFRHNVRNIQQGAPPAPYKYIRKPGANFITPTNLNDH